MFFILFLLNITKLTNLNERTNSKNRVNFFVGVNWEYNRYCFIMLTVPVEVFIETSLVILSDGASQNLRKFLWKKSTFYN